MGAPSYTKIQSVKYKISSISINQTCPVTQTKTIDSKHKLGVKINSEFFWGICIANIALDEKHISFFL
jgi:hypothetical protein